MNDLFDWAEQSAIEWRPVPGYKHYEVSRCGKVRSLARTTTRGGRPVRIRERILKNTPINTGYLIVSIFREDDQKRICVHRLVAGAFVDNAENYPEVNHKNGIKTDNRADNLEWCTKSQNRIHARDTGLIRTTKLNREIVRLIRACDCSSRFLATLYDVSIKTIQKVRNRERWKDV